MNSDERTLVRRARDGDAAACHDMVDRYSDYLYRLAFSLVGNAADAEDVLQETFSGAFRSLRRFEARASLKTWLSQILVRQAARCHRSRARHKMAALDAEPEPGQAPHDSASDTRMDMLAALDALSTEHREVIVLREFQGMTYEEIADVLEAPRGTVESRLFRAREQLKARLKDYLA